MIFERITPDDVIVLKYYDNKWLTIPAKISNDLEKNYHLRVVDFQRLNYFKMAYFIDFIFDRFFMSELSVDI